MLTVTEAAGARLAQILGAEDFSEEIAVRLVFEERAITMQPDSERPGDATFQHEGCTVLLLDEQVAQLLTEDTLDVDGEKLTLRGGKDSA